VVSFTLKLRLTPPGKTPTKPEVLDITQGTKTEEGGAGIDIEGEEQSIAELIGRRNEKEDGVIPTPLAHAPHFLKVCCRLSLVFAYSTEWLKLMLAES